MTNPNATLEREGWSLTAKNREKLMRMREIVRGRIQIRVTPQTVRRALRPLRAVAFGDWDIDWRHGWRAAQYARSAISGALQFRNFVG